MGASIKEVKATIKKKVHNFTGVDGTRRLARVAWRLLLHAVLNVWQNGKKPDAA